MTDQGEVDIEEDEVGNVTIGGEALTFDSWAKFNKTLELHYFHDMNTCL